MLGHLLPEENNDCLLLTMRLFMEAQPKVIYPVAGQAVDIRFKLLDTISNTQHPAATYINWNSGLLRTIVLMQYQLCHAESLDIFKLSCTALLLAIIEMGRIDVWESGKASRESYGAHVRGANAMLRSRYACYRGQPAFKILGSFLKRFGVTQCPKTYVELREKERVNLSSKNCIAQGCDLG